MEDYQKITTPEAAFKLLNREFIMPDVSAWPEKHRAYALADFLLIHIFEACNMQNGKIWEPNWLDVNEEKWEIRFWIDKDSSSPSGVGFSNANCVSWHSSSTGGSRLCTRNSKIAKHIFETFRSILLDRILFTYVTTKK